MLRLASLMYSILGTTLAGVGVIIAVSLGQYDANAIIMGAAIGALAALPASWVVARRIINAT